MTGKTEFFPTPFTDILLGQTATALRDGRILVAGGASADDTTVAAAVALFDPATRTWTSLGPMRQARWLHTATLLADGRVLIVGGSGTGSGSNAPDPTAQTSEIFDPATGRFDAGPAVPVPMWEHTATALKDGRVLLAKFPLAYLFDPPANRFALVASIPKPRYGATATLLEDGSVLIAGGAISDGAALASAQRFDPTTGRFTDVGSMSVGRALHSAAPLPGGRVLIAGGDSTPFGTTKDAVLNTTEIFDPATGAFSPGPLLTSPRYLHTATALADGRVVITGGSTGSEALASIEVYTPPTPAKPFAGSAPAAGSQGLIVTGRTVTAEDLVKAATADGCSPRVIATLQAGTWRIFIPGAPTAVNSAFPASLPPSSPLFMGCS